MLTPQFKKIWHWHRETYKPVHMSLEYDELKGQLQLPIEDTENLYSSYHAHVKMGQFFEILTQALFGGRLCDSVVEYKGNGFKGHIKPDVINGKEKMAFESKANRSGHQMNLLDCQIQSYRLFQIVNPKHQVYFCFYRHGFRKVKNTTISPNELNRQLAQKTYAIIMLPFDIVHTIWESDHPEFKRYETELWHHCTRVKSPYMNMFLFNPEKALDMIGLSHLHFGFNRYRTPPDLTIQGCPIEPALLLVVKSLKYRKWVEYITNQIPF